MHLEEGDFLVSDDTSRLKVQEIHALFQQGDWACATYSVGKIEKLLTSSFWLGMYLQGQLIGIARMVTDKETVTLITDFIIHKGHRNKGLGSRLMSCLVEHPDLNQTSMCMGTQGQDHFFKRFGFERHGSYMHRYPKPPSPPSKAKALTGWSPKQPKCGDGEYADADPKRA
jgi:predicted GNAT family N-acyltransferase